MRIKFVLAIINNIFFLNLLFIGIQNFCWDIEFMLKRKVGIYWRISWTIVTPVVLVFILIYFLTQIERLKYENFDYPDLALGDI